MDSRALQRTQRFLNDLISDPLRCIIAEGISPMSEKMLAPNRALDILLAGPGTEIDTVSGISIFDKDASIGAVDDRQSGHPTALDCPD